MKVLKQFISFGLVGAVNTLLSLMIQWICLAIGFHYMVGSVLAFLITVFISYILNNVFAFKEESGGNWSIKALVKVYVSYSVTGLFLNSALLFLWNDIVGLNPNISPIINLCFTIPTNYVLNKYWAYKSKL